MITQFYYEGTGGRVAAIKALAATGQFGRIKHGESRQYTKLPWDTPAEQDALGITRVVVVKGSSNIPKMARDCRMKGVELEVIEDPCPSPNKATHATPRQEPDPNDPTVQMAGFVKEQGSATRMQTLMMLEDRLDREEAKEAPDADKVAKLKARIEAMDKQIEDSDKPADDGLPTISQAQIATAASSAPAAAEGMANSPLSDTSTPEEKATLAAAMKTGSMSIG